jgi:hypothetical protein
MWGCHPGSPRTNPAGKGHGMKYQWSPILVLLNMPGLKRYTPYTHPVFDDFFNCLFQELFSSLHFGTFDDKEGQLSR